jgi:hypothetical protein
VSYAASAFVTSSRIGLGRGLVVNMSWWINAFFSGISPFLDPITRDKVSSHVQNNVPSLHSDPIQPKAGGAGSH